MLDDECKRMLDAFIKDLPNQPSYGYDPISVARISNMNDGDADRVSRYLSEQGYLRSVETPKYANLDFGNRYYLTEKGKKYKALEKQEVKKYIADKWIDFLALLVAALALLKSFWPDIQIVLKAFFQTSPH